MKYSYKNTILFLGFLIILYVIWYYIFKSKNKYTLFVKGPEFLTDTYNKSFSDDKIYKSKEGIKYTYLFWIFLKNIPNNANWNSGYDSQKGIISHFHSPNVYYTPSKNLMEISFGYKNAGEQLLKYVFEVDNLKLQTWQHVACVVNDRYISIYINGKIYKATLLPNVPWLADRILYLGQPNNNCNGYISYFEYYNNALDGDQVMSIYNDRKNSLSTDLMSYSQYYYNKKTKITRPANLGKDNWLNQLFFG